MLRAQREKSCSKGTWPSGAVAETPTLRAFVGGHERLGMERQRIEARSSRIIGPIREQNGPMHVRGTTIIQRQAQRA